MTIEVFARRIAASLGWCGFGLLIAAAIFWSTVGDGDEVVRSIHNVAGSIVAVFGVVLLAVSLTLSAGLPARRVDSRADTHAPE